MILILVLAAWLAQAPAAPPDTEIFLAPLSVAHGGVTIGKPVNITNSPGYDNQPSFTPDGRAILFASVRGGGRLPDIYRYDIRTRQINRVTDTPEGEYSPTVTPDGRHISVVRVEADSIQRVPKRGTISFVERQPAPGANARPTLWIRELDPRTKRVMPIVRAVEGATEADCAWTPDGMLLMAHNGALWGWRQGESPWRVLADLEALGLKEASRLAVSPNGDRIAIVAQAK